MYICSQVTSSRDGFLVVVYCLLSKASGKEGCDQLTAMNFKNILFFGVLFFVFICSLFLYLLGNVTSVISVIAIISVYYCC